MKKLAVLLAFAGLVSVSLTAQQPFARDPKVAIDEDYTKKIKEYTTQPFFTSPLVDYLPASKTVPTPKTVLGDVAGAPGRLPYAEEVYQYMRMLEKASPRVKVYSIGQTEEGREMIAVAVTSEANMAKLQQNSDRLAKLADPRTIDMDDAQAEKLLDGAVPVYYITGTIHSPETGSPTALMELAYRLAVDDHSYIKSIRDNLITLITPVIEVDGRNKMVDIYKWHLANPGKNWPGLVYWGKYVAHDNNRDAMGVTLKLTENVMKTYIQWRPQVLHDLHESVPYLYDNTVGDGPYNAWIDPILADEWQMIGWNNVSEMTKFGMPGVFTHGNFDTWSPGYLMFIAALHNGISRLYETFGNGGADTVERTLQPNDYARTWYKQNPPLPKTVWSQRNNNNYQQTGLLTSLHYFAANKQLFLRNFYTKSKRSILKAKIEGPAAYVFPADDPRPGAQADLLRVLQKQGVEITRATSSFTVTVPSKKTPPRPSTTTTDGAGGPGGSGGPDAQDSQDRQDKQDAKPQPTTRTFPAGTYLVRMDQPYSRIADSLLDYQYWSPNDPQRTPYDDTGWTFPELFNVQAVRVADLKVLDAPAEKVTEVRVNGGLTNTGSIFLINHNADTALITLRYRFKDASFEAAEEPFEAEGKKFSRGTFIIKSVAAGDVQGVAAGDVQGVAAGEGVAAGDMQRAASELGLNIVATATAPSVKTHPIRAPRIAIMHTWATTQTEGWWRQAFDLAKVPFTYISTQDAAADSNLSAKFDVIIFPPVGRGTDAIVNGMPMWGNPLPWKKTAETPNLGSEDETDDMRPGLGWMGVAHLQDFVRKGGLLITSMDTADLAVGTGFTPGVSIAARQRLRIVGSVVRSKMVDATSPIAYGYTDNLGIWCDNGPIINVSNIYGGRGGRRLGPDDGGNRPTGRGTADDPDVPQGRLGAEITPEPRVEAWQATPVTDEQLRNGINVIPPSARPRVVLRYADNRDLLVSGLVENGSEIAQHPAVVDATLDKGHVVIFSNNPIWRGETLGSYFLVYNAIMNFDQLDAGRKLDSK
ncbi:MAG TPA: M14 family zinc carboxypeptidase [Vicinamibacterales bacterium]|nr:M14 family zinc carboxypeptidase [Vicinamibacterales bacterium]